MSHIIIFVYPLKNPLKSIVNMKNPLRSSLLKVSEIIYAPSLDKLIETEKKKKIK